MDIIALVEMIVVRIRRNISPFIMSTCDGRGTSRPRVAPDVVVDGLPKATSADGIVATEHLHLRVEQEQIDYTDKETRD